MKLMQYSLKRIALQPRAYKNLYTQKRIFCTFNVQFFIHPMYKNYDLYIFCLNITHKIHTKINKSQANQTQHITNIAF